MKNNSGILGKFNLIDWWFNEFSPETQNYILEICENSTSMHDNLLTGKVNTNMSATHFLWSFASRFLVEPYDQSIGLKILAKAEEIGLSEKDFIYLHFVYCKYIESVSRSRKKRKAM